LSNTNESVIVSILQIFLELNKTLEEEEGEVRADTGMEAQVVAQWERRGADMRGRDDISFSLSFFF